jgi:hypothetical protein
MLVVIVPTAQWHGELVTGFNSQAARLSETQMSRVYVRVATARDAAWLRFDVTEVFPRSVSDRHQRIVGDQFHHCAIAALPRSVISIQAESFVMGCTVMSF